ncbi:MAG: hypothetical protein IPM13_10895 [Phycisphaerales bacterium]|nr:hypothetical protein [Phycisphaerales bacterium]
MIGRTSLLFATLVLLSATLAARAQNWDTVPLITHATYQAVTAQGASAYGGGFPVRLRGVVLNNPEDWLDPTPNYNEQLFNLGGQWEIFVQATEPGDFGGTAAWMGQCYGNLPFIGDPDFNYTDVEWVAELQRLDYPDDTDQPPLRAGDYIELRARAGLPFAGKMNVNEQHSLSPLKDFDIVRLGWAVGLPAPAAITLSDLVNAASVPIFDPTRQIGGERHQASRVAIRGVRLASAAGWGPNTNPRLALVDTTGRQFPMHLGRNASFAQFGPPAGYFTVTGFLNQESASGRDGYYLMVMNHADLLCGDANCDGAVDFDDIDPFVLALSNAAQYAAAYPGCFVDLTGDNAVTFDDIDPFVAALSGNGRCGLGE